MCYNMSINMQLALTWACIVLHLKVEQIENKALLSCDYCYSPLAPYILKQFVIFRFIFLEFSNAKDAAQAVKTANGYKLDKHHIFAVNHFEDFDK